MGVWWVISSPVYIVMLLEVKLVNNVKLIIKCTFIVYVYFCFVLQL